MCATGCQTVLDDEHAVVLGTEVEVTAVLVCRTVVYLHRAVVVVLVEAALRVGYRQTVDHAHHIVRIVTTKLETVAVAVVQIVLDGHRHGCL